MLVKDRGTMRGIILLATCVQLLSINVAFGSAFTDRKVRSTAHVGRHHTADLIMWRQVSESIPANSDTESRPPAPPGLSA